MKVALHFSLKRESLDYIDGYEIGDIVLRTMISHGDLETAFEPGICYGGYMRWNAVVTCDSELGLF
jgi:hypothetical protein